VQRLRNQELKQVEIKRKQVWRPKDKLDESGRSAPTCMVCVRCQGPNGPGGSLGLGLEIRSSPCLGVK
jgi:hypothetical protein